MKTFFLWLGALILLLVVSGFIYRVIYALRTGHDLAADRLNAAANVLPATAAASGFTSDPIAALG